MILKCPLSDQKAIKTLINWAVNLNEEWLETDKGIFTMQVLARGA